MIRELPTTAERKTILLIRHCRVLPEQDQGGGPANAWRAKPYIGRTDLPLTPTGILEADALAEHLTEWLRVEACAEPATHSSIRHPDVPIAILLSPARRAMETARRVAASLALSRKTGPEIQQDPNLWEVGFGRWEGKTFPEIAAMDPERVDQWARGGMDFRFPEGESLVAFRARVMRAGNRISRHPAKIVLVVTHGGVIDFLLCRFLGLPPLHYRFQVDTGSVCRCDL